ncbi:MAG: hypothetical protein JSR77_01315 [Planctomycetes bacterium]|nr:hypothetical protein [Planctomycetota bacterium]
MQRTPRTLFGLCAAVAAMLSACSPEPLVAGRVYPAESPIADQTLDIQVFRREGELEFTNTTARAFGPGIVWVNRRFSCPIPGLALGQSVSLPLHDFKDEYSASFRAGGFFAREAPDRVVSCELEIPGEGEGAAHRWRMVVVKGEPD